MELHELIQNKETVKEQYYREEHFDMTRGGKGLDLNRHDRKQPIEYRVATDSGNREVIVRRPFM